MSLDDSVEQSYEGTVKESKFKKFAKYSLVGAAALTSMALYSCVGAPPTSGENSNDDSTPEVQAPIIYNIEAQSEDSVGDLRLTYEIQTFEGTQVYLKITGNGEVIYDGTLVGGIKDDGGAHVNYFVYFDANILDSNIFPYHVDLIFSGDSEFKNATEYSIDLTVPMRVFGRKSPERVGKLESLLETMISSNQDVFYFEGAYVMYGDFTTFKVVSKESQDQYFVLGEDIKGGFLSLAASKPSEPSTSVTYVVANYHPPDDYPDMTLEQFLQMLDIEGFTVVSTTEVIAPRPLEIFEHSKATLRENVYPLYEYNLFLLDALGRIVGYEKRYFEGETLSRTPLKRIDYFINGDDVFLIGKDTGNLLSVITGMEGSLESSTYKVLLFSPTYNVGPLPGDPFYESPEVIILENNWDNPLDNISEMPQEYKDLVIQSLDDAIAAIDELTSP